MGYFSLSIAEKERNAGIKAFPLLLDTAPPKALHGVILRITGLLI